MWVSRKKYKNLKEELEQQISINQQFFENIDGTNERIKANNLTEENERLKNRIKELYKILKENKEMIDTLNAAHNEEIECNRSNSCRFCGYSAIVRTTSGDKCVCTYGLCKRFKPAEEVRSDLPE